jgi:hypothetical protein
MAERDEDQPLTLDQLPDDPLKMPPPYWRSCGAVFHILDSLEALDRLLHELIPIHASTEQQLIEYRKKYPEYDKDDEAAAEAFHEIVGDLILHEHKIRLKAEIACLMSSIEAEDAINKFCVFNLPHDLAESVEKLSTSEKLLIVSAAAGKPSVKGNTVFEGARRLARWRNAYAHGHCVDRPTKSIRTNHLIHPEDFPGVPSSLNEVKQLVGAYLRIADYLGTISTNPYTAGKLTEVEEIRKLLTGISKYRFSGNNNVYEVIFDGETQKG